MSFSFYFFIIIVTGILAELSVRIEEKTGRYIAIFFTLLIPSFFAGIRFDVGTDYFAYENIFSALKAGESLRTEFGFNFLNVVVAKLGGNVHILFFIMSFLTILFIYLSLYKMKNSISVGLGMVVFLLFYYHDSFNTVRQVLAIAITLYSFTFILEKKLWKFSITTLIAMSMHYSSLVVAPFYFIYNLAGKNNRLFRIFIYIGTILLLFNYGILLEFLLNIFTGFSYYSRYLPVENESSFGIGLILLNAPLIIPGLIFYKRLVEKDARFKFYFFFLMIGIIIKFLGYFGADYLTRIADPFFVAVVVVIPYYYKYLRENIFEHLLGVSIIIFVFLTWFYNYIYIGLNETIPYKTFFWIFQH